MSSAEVSALGPFLHQVEWASVVLVLGCIYRKPIGACLNAWASRIRRPRK